MYGKNNARARRRLFLKVGLGLLFVGEAVRGEHDAYASDAMAGPGARSGVDWEIANIFVVDGDSWDVV
jgi:hypothetical protein